MACRSSADIKNKLKDIMVRRVIDPINLNYLPLPNKERKQFIIPPGIDDVQVSMMYRCR